MVSEKGHFVTQHIIIVGGGYAGSNIAHALDKIAKVTLIEPREAFVHNVAAMRALVSPELLDQIIIPYDWLLTNGEIIRARASRIEEGRVTLEDGRIIDGDIVIAATGSTYAQPFKPTSPSMTDFRAQQQATHTALQAAKTVAIIGAGPVGVELAAEIASRHPMKKVTLYAGSDTVVPGVSNKLSSALHKQILEMGIDLRLGVMTSDLEHTDKPYSGTFMANGKSVAADLVVPVFGAVPVLPPLDGTAAPSGRLKVDGWMRPEGYMKVFSFGDAAESGDPMTIIAVRRQMNWLVKALTAMLKGTDLESIAPYKAAEKPFLLVPLGQSSGSSVFPFSRSGWVVGPWLTQKIKGKDLFIEKTRKEMGY